MNYLDEINRRRTFGIVSHPDAGKTTLTEKLLLFGGAIRVAGAVKNNKIKKTATSDFMEIERQRGISVATSVMGFEYNDMKINILDTPGHQDFAEDTFRTLTAVDSAIVVIDAAKGVENQTERLMEVCHMHKTPVIVFINKMDREGRDPFDLMDEIEEKLKIKVRPLSFPIGIGAKFQGIYNLYEKNIRFFSGNKQHIDEELVIQDDLGSDELDKQIGEDPANELREHVELVNGVYGRFNKAEYREGTVAPVFFGSALYTLGVKELLDTFIDIAPEPQPRKSQERLVKPEEGQFSGFVFKIHANLDPKHRDRLAFVKIVSGKFERNKNYYHIRLGRYLKFSSPTTFMASRKEVVEEAYPGDIVGLHDTGNFKIGDTLTGGETLHFKGLPSFSPEMFKYVENADPLKYKQLVKGIDQLMDEGVAQLFVRNKNGRKIIGTVGQLQYEVIEYRLKHEYGATSRYEPINLYKACWISGDSKKMDEFRRKKHHAMATDKHGNDVFLAESRHALRMAQEAFPELAFHFRSEMQ